MICSAEDGCDRAAYARGLCLKHYQRARYIAIKNGDTDWLEDRRRKSEEEKLESRREKRRRKYAITGETNPEKLERKRERNRRKGRAYYEKNKERLAAKILERSREPGEQERRRQYQIEYKARPDVQERTKMLQEKYRKSGKAREYSLKKYGLTLEQWQGMFNAQGGICATDGCRNKATDTDHDHETGAVRGLLCRSCNILLGRIEKSPHNVEALKKYKNKAM